MNLLMEMVILIIIGAVIGGVTNSIAIKMLFRPYRPIYFGSWRLPFTPGLIPKRRNELASQLGKTVMDHLLTPESIRRKLADADFQEEVVSWAQTQAKTLLEREDSLDSLFSGHFCEEDLKYWIEDKLDDSVKAMIERIGNYTIEERLPQNWQAKIRDCIPMLAEHLAKGGADFLETEEGRTRIQELIHQFISGRGMFSNMLNMFLGGESVGQMVQTELVKLLRRSMSKRLFERFLEKEWETLKRRSISDFQLEDAAKDISAIIKKEWPIKHILHAPIKEWSQPYRDKIVSRWVPNFVNLAGQALTARVEELLGHLRLEEVVKAQVETFAVERLEQLVLSISRREFKMITYLGALLGGIIGLIQGVIIQLFS